MPWLVYENIDESTKLLIGILAIIFCAFVIIGRIYFWLVDIKEWYIKRKKK